jgi:hypothetical protein
MRAIDLYIYEDNGAGGYRLRESLPAMSSSSHMLADLNGDGSKDLVVFNHTGINQYDGLQPISGTHGYGSYLYYGDDDGFSTKTRQQIPSFGPHKTIDAEWGDVAQRRSYETYVAPRQEQSIGHGAYHFIVAGNFHPSAPLGLDVRGQTDASWTALEPDGEEESDVRRFKWSPDVSLDGFQYRLRFDHGTSGTPPAVKSVELRRD